MTTPPFIADALPSLDTQPRDRVSQTPLRQFYLGRAGSMIQLPSPALNYDAPLSQGESAKTTLAGSQTVTRLYGVKARWTLNWTKLAGRDWQVVYGFYRRLFGPGPWFLVVPDEVNRLSEAGSLCGSTGALSGWSVSAGTLAYDGTVAAPVVPAGVMRWSSATAGALLVYGTAPAGVPTPDGTAGPPSVVSEPATYSMYVKTASGSATVKMRLSGRQADGTLTSEWDSGTKTVSSAGWTRLSVTVGPGDLGAAAFAVPVVQCVASSVDILLSAPQFEYADAASDWEVGNGSPRVVCVSLTRSVDESLKRTVTMVLGQS